MRKVLWLCEEMAVPFEREDWGRGYQPTSDPRFLELNPMGLIPAVIDEGILIREDRTPSFGTLRPSTPRRTLSTRTRGAGPR